MAASGVCRICLRSFKQLRFVTQHIAICRRCVRSVNEASQVAQLAEARIAALLARGIVRRAEREVTDADAWIASRASWTLANLEQAQRKALPNWLNRLLKDPANTSLDFKLLRAHRRGMLHFDRPRGWGYPPRWPAVAERIRRRDGDVCAQCGDDDAELHVHHIVYVSNFGTHQRSNLVCLCRACHESEHGRTLDFGEGPESEAESDSESESESGDAPAKVGVALQVEPIQPVLSGVQPPVPQITAPRPPTPSVDCPRCLTRFSALLRTNWSTFEADCQVCGTVSCWADDGELLDSLPPLTPTTHEPAPVAEQAHSSSPVPTGLCPNCAAEVAVDAKSCPACRVELSISGTWQVLRIRSRPR